MKVAYCNFDGNVRKYKLLLKVYSKIGY